MVIRFENAYLEKLVHGKAVAGKPKYSSNVIIKFKKAILKLRAADNTRQIRSFKGLDFDALKGDMKGYYSVRVDRSYRLILTIEEEGRLLITEVLAVHDLNNHYQ